MKYKNHLYKTAAGAGLFLFLLIGTAWTTARANVSDVYVDAERASSGTGTYQSPFNNMEEAMAGVSDGGTIWLLKGIPLQSNAHWNMSSKPNTVIKRHEDYSSDYMIYTKNRETVNLKLTGVVLDLAYPEVPLFTDETGNETTGTGIYVNAGMTLEFGGNSVIKNSYGNTARGISIEKEGIAKMTGGKITNNNCLGIGGGIAVIGELEMTGGEISGNSANTGGGIYVIDTGKAQIKDGAVIRNNIGGNGGGISVFLGSVDIREGAQISGNTAESGGGIYNMMGTVNISGSQITGNSAGSNGGGVYTSSYASLKTDGALFSDNQASAGYFWTVDENASSGHSGSYNQHIKNSQDFSKGILNGGAVKYTNAYNNEDINFTPGYSGSPASVEKTVSGGGLSADVNDEITYEITFKNGSDGKLVNVEMTDELPDYVELVSFTTAYSYKLYTAGGTETSNAKEAKKIVWDIGEAAYGETEPILQVKVKVLAGASEQTITNKAVKSYELFDSQEETDLESSVDVNVNKSPFLQETYVNGRITNPGGTGTYANPFDNMEDAMAIVADGGTIWVLGGVIVKTGAEWDMSGKPNAVIKRHTDFSGECLITVSGQSGGELKMTGVVLDLAYGEIPLSNNATGRGIIVSNGGKLEFGENSIIQNAYGLSAGGVIVEENAVMKMTGGEIRNNTVTAEQNTAGVGAGIIAAGRLEMTGGKITGNKADGVHSCGGGIATMITGAIVEIKGAAVIHNNFAGAAGGGIYNLAGTIKISGGARISGNEAGDTGGGIFTMLGMVSVSDSLVSDNSAGSSGGGVYAASYTALKTDRVEFTKNEAGRGYFWTVDEAASAGYSGSHNQYIKNSADFSEGMFEGAAVRYTNAYNNKDVNYTPGYSGLPAEMEKTVADGSGIAEVDSEITYDIKFKNKSDGKLVNVELTDELPNHVELVSCTGVYPFKLYTAAGTETASYNEAGKIVWKVGDMEYGGTEIVLEVKVKVLKSASEQTIINKAVKSYALFAGHDEDDLESSVNVNVAKTKGEISLIVPKEFAYGKADISAKKQYYGLNWKESADQGTGENIIAVEDTRDDAGKTWNLTLKLKQDVTDQDGTGQNSLNDVLVYRSSGTETCLSKDTSIPVADHSSHTSVYNWISQDWYLEYTGSGTYPLKRGVQDGLYMVLRAGQGSVEGSESHYRGVVEWTLQNTP